MLPIPRGSREEKLTKLIIISWFVRFYICVYSSSLLSSRKRGVHKMIFYSISSTSVGLFEFFAFFVLTICPFQARKRKTRRVGNQIDGETHMRNLKLKTHKISTDILSCTNYWQLKDERSISARGSHTKKNRKTKTKISKTGLPSFPLFSAPQSVFGLAFSYVPLDVQVYIGIYVYMHIKRQLVVIKLYTKAVESFLFRWCQCRFFIFGIASFCETVRFGSVCFGSVL